MKKITKIIICALTAVAVLGASLGVYFGYSDTSFKQREYTVDSEEGNLRIAVISDLQLPDSNDKTTHQYESFEATLTMLKNRGMDVLVIAGDFTDVSTKAAWSTYKEIYDRVMADAEQPVKLSIMGNHDYWLPMFNECFEIPSPAKLQRRYNKHTGEPVNSHNIINGYHFICWGSLDGSYDKCNNNTDKVRAELDKAVKDDPNKPIFVISHLNPQDTAYGSDDWGNADINTVLKDYPQVISLSGHSHYSLIDERSIWQGDYTAFTTQSLDYIELEHGKFNGSVPKDAYGNSIAEAVPSCIYMTVSQDNVTVERLEANTGKQLKEPWVINAPFGENTQFTQARSDSNAAPTLDKDLTVKITDIKDVNNGSDNKMISFKAGSDDDFVHSYRLKFYDENNNLLSFEETDYSEGYVIKYDKNGDKVSKDSKEYESAEPKSVDELLYFSDFVLGLENMSPTAKLRLPVNLPDSAKYVSITAIDSWGAESNTVMCEMEG